MVYGFRSSFLLGPQRRPSLSLTFCIFTYSYNYKLTCTYIQASRLTYTHTYRINSDSVSFAFAYEMNSISCWSGISIPKNVIIQTSCCSKKKEDPKGPYGNQRRVSLSL